MSIDHDRSAYVHYIGIDETQLNSEIIVSLKNFNPESPQNTSRNKSDFFSHVFLNVCIKYGGWEVVGNATAPDFRDAVFGVPDITSDIREENYLYIWKPNEIMKKAHGAKLGGNKIEPGQVSSYISISRLLISE
ncbi:hypothetical protein [Paracoccus sp. IB05]|uniref:hypothetical protein n=1 Tax=Paracoccus sp. IB05 TaxID=2779367 RepID=UPI0018E766AB|nr:hypothetical protein [Paracoccus sp. IB05]MBJ2151664.1 hypothetical protein [Paracoccus sp. IB05]